MDKALRTTGKRKTQRINLMGPKFKKRPLCNFVLAITSPINFNYVLLFSRIISNLILLRKDGMLRHVSIAQQFVLNTKFLQ